MSVLNEKILKTYDFSSDILISENVQSEFLYLSGVNHEGVVTSVTVDCVAMISA